MAFQNISDYVAAIGALGTAAYGLVDASKAFGGGVSNIGFHRIEAAIRKLFPTEKDDAQNPLPLRDLIATLRANWLNGTALADQKSIAKTLIKLRITAKNAKDLAARTGVDKDKLIAVATNLAEGGDFTDELKNVLGRFDLILTALLDEAYQRADQAYRNAAKAWSVLASVLLAVFGSAVVWNLGASPGDWGKWGMEDLPVAILVGLLATPLAPVSKDLASALTTAVKSMQILKR